MEDLEELALKRYQFRARDLKPEFIYRILYVSRSSAAFD